MNSLSCQFHSNKLGHLVGLALILLIWPFTDLEAVPLIQNGANCMSADDFMAKNPTDQAKIAQIRQIEDIIIKVGSIPNITPPLAICETRDQIGRGAFVTNRNEPLRMTTGMLKILGSDADMIAALVGHEIAHLTLNHLRLEQSEEPTFIADANNVAQATMNQNANIDDARKSFSIIYYGERAAFIRTQESEADDRGIEFASKAGFDPEGARKLFSIVFNKIGGAYAGFFDDHPGLAERFVESGTRIEDERFDQVAASLVIQKKWKDLNSTIQRWIKVLPRSPNAWYYAAKLHHDLKSEELSNLENTFTYSEPSLSKMQNQIDHAWITMCIDLYTQDYIVESANCSRALNDVNKKIFNQVTFRGILIVGANDPAPIKLSFITDDYRGKVITNGDWPNIRYGPATPAWKPVRFDQTQ